MPGRPSMPPARAVTRWSRAWTPAADGRLLLALGQGTPWQAAGPDVEWLELALVVQAQGQWHPLPLRWVDVPDANALQGPTRSGLLLDANALAATGLGRVQPGTAGLGIPPLPSACVNPLAHRWVCRRSGLGAVLLLAIDLAVRGGDGGWRCQLSMTR